MSQTPLPPSSADDLQFEVVEAAPTVAAIAAPAPQRMSCVACKRPIAASYFAVAGKVVCPQCAQQYSAPPAGSAAGRFAKAAVFGLGAGLLGALIWFAVRRIANMEIGLIAILVGFMVGKAIRKGSGGRGGRGYQILAVVLTYGCIAANYVPDVLEGVQTYAHAHPTSVQHAPAPADPAKLVVGYAIIYGVALALPFLGGARNLIGLLIIGFALLQAWKLTADRKLPLTGPYQLGARAVAARPLGVRT